MKKYGLIVVTADGDLRAHIDKDDGTMAMYDDYWIRKLIDACEATGLYRKIIIVPHEEPSCDVTHARINIESVLHSS